jgi:DNA-binding transcriptional MerR regulator/effector-binding domain-containing protein
MTDNAFFTASDFAKLSRTTKATLHHYDDIGLLAPLSRGEENNYRYYSCGQLAVVNVIRTLQALGMSLSEIKTLIDRRTPAFMDEVFTQQIDKINKKIDEWARARKLLLTLQKSIHSVANASEDAITIQFLPAEAIVLGDLNDYSRGRNAYHALVSFYNEISKQWPDLDLNYPVWAVFSEDRIKRGDWVWPDRYYFYNPEGRDKRPAAFYAIGYTRGGYGQNDELYKRMIDFIDKNGFEISGDAYEEYPLNEVCIADDANYLMRTMITVREKNQRQVE